MNLTNLLRDLLSDESTDAQPSPNQPDQHALEADLTDDAGGWTAITRAGPGPQDRGWGDLQQAYTDALEAWRYNSWVRQIVTLHRAYVLGDGLNLSSSDPGVQQFIDEFWVHPENRMAQRLSGWVDELMRTGEIYPVLFTNKISGMSHVRAVPASSISAIETDPNDYEKELEYHELVHGQVEPKVWKSWRSARPGRIDSIGRRYKPEPMMLHYAVNRPVGATRGESDLTPLLPWAQRYTEWLKQRVLFNKIRNLLAIMWIKVNDENQVDSKREEYESNPPGEGSIFVTGPDEEVSFPSARIEGFQAEPDGKAIRLAMAASANLSLVHFGEGDTANLSTTNSMDDRTYRFYRQRQEDVGVFLVDLTEHAYRRYCQVLEKPEPDDMQIAVEFSDISRSDNEMLAGAAFEMVKGLAEMKRVFSLGKAFDEIALPMAFRFAGELLPADTIKQMLEDRTNGTTDPDPAQNGNGNGNGATESALYVPFGPARNGK